jgi:hypothetical protein
MPVLIACSAPDPLAQAARHSNFATTQPLVVTAKNPSNSLSWEIREMLPQSFDNRPGVIWYDGQFVDWPDAKLHVLSHGLHYASAVFEGQRA